MFKREISSNELSASASLSATSLSLHKYNELVRGRESIPLPLDPSTHSRMAASVDAVNNALIDNEIIYGITTGFGGMSETRIDCQAAAELQSNLLTFLAASAGPEIDARHTRGAMLLRATVLLNGNSGIRPIVVEQILKYLESGAVPVVRELGSIGASGDLVPLSTIARAVTGQSGRVKVRLRDGEVVDSVTALQRIGLKPIELRAKEGLALVNGTSFSSSIAANATVHARHALSISMAIQSLMMTALKVDPNPFEAFVHALKPHPGQIWSATVMRGLLPEPASDATQNESVQDRYSLRCYPQYNGPIVEGLARVQQTVEIEMNSVSDNPLIDSENGQFYQSGNFLGQYVGIAMDDLRKYVGLLAKHLDVQIASLVAPEFNRGLPPSLRGNDDRSLNMGLKGLQICGNSIMPMLTHIANPIVDHFPTHAEQFNQNVNGLSWGSAHLAWKSIEMFQQYLAVASLFAIQAVDLRAKAALGHFDGRELLRETSREFYDAVCERLSATPTRERPLLGDDTDRWLEQDIEDLAADIADEGTIVQSVKSITDSFDDFRENQS